MLRLHELAGGVGIGHDARPGLEMELAVGGERRADGDGRVQVAVVGQVPHPAGVGPAATPLHLSDDLHGPRLGGPGDRAGRKDRAQRVHGRRPLVQGALDLGDDVLDMGELLHPHVLRHGDRAALAHSGEVVAGQIDQHGMLGPLLLVQHQLLAVAAPSGHALAQRPGAGDGEGRRFPPPDGQERFRAAAQDGPSPKSRKNM